MAEYTFYMENNGYNYQNTIYSDIGNGGYVDIETNYGAKTEAYVYKERFSLAFQKVTESITITVTLNGQSVSTTRSGRSGTYTDIDLTKSILQYATLDGKFAPLTYSIDITASDCDVYMVDANGNKTTPFHIEGTYTHESLDYRYAPQYTRVLTAPNFSDEENPTITYSRGSAELNYDYAKVVKNIQAVISLDGTNDDIVRDINFEDTSVTSLTFNLTEEEREILRRGVVGANSKQILFRMKTIPVDRQADNIPPYYHDLTKTLTIAGAYVSATLDVEDTDPSTLALTGDKNTIVKYHSDAAYVINSTATKSATIVSEEVVCGNKTGTTETGVLEDVESGTFTFLAIDSRNNAASGTLTKNFIDYIKLTCQQKIEIDLSGAEGTGAAATAKIEGNYWRGNFGLTDNSLVVQIRHTQNDGSMGDWVTLTDFVEVNYGEGTYSLSFGISGLDYAKPYTFQCRAIDKLATATTAEYTTRVMPVFDWSGEDFSFNVPVNINSDTLNFQEHTVIRHTGTNTVLSGEGGNVYIRPGGTDDTSNETIFYGNGDIVFGGAVDLGDSFTIGGDTLEDFIIETGEESMGSNGTWYWAKWKSGKAECWGCRNFGNMAVTTAWGGLYRSAILTQDLPEDVFITTPDVININIVNSNFGGWICKYENNAPSAVTTGSFIFVRPASATVSPTYIGFHVIGLWKQ